MKTTLAPKNSSWKQSYWSPIRTLSQLKLPKLGNSSHCTERRRRRPKLCEHQGIYLGLNLSLSFTKLNRPLPSSKNPHFQNEASCTNFLVKMSFICMRMKNDFHIKGWAPTLVLKQRPGRTTKWPILLLFVWCPWQTRDSKRDRNVSKCLRQKERFCYF